MPSTDVATAPVVDPGAKSGQWDSVLSDAIASTGINPSAPLPDAEEPASQTPPVAERQSSAPPSAPAPAATGDSGTGQPEAAAAQPAATPPDAPEGTEEQIPDANPFTYLVDGQPKTIEGAYVLPGEGLFVPEATVPHFQQLATRAEILDRQNRELTARTESYEKAVEWNDGKQVLKGAQAVEAQRVYIERLQEAVKGFASVLTPQNFAKYVSIGQNQDGSYYVVPDAQAIKELQDRMAFQAERAEFNARKAFAPIAQTFSAGQPTPSAPADAPIDAIAAPTVDALATEMRVTLSPESKTFLVAQLPRYVRPTTPEERPQYGPRIVDAAFKALVEREAKAQQSVQTATTAATTAAKFNGGMQQGRKPAPAPARSSTPHVPAKPPEKVGKAETWDKVFQDAMADIQV